MAVDQRRRDPAAAERPAFRGRDRRQSPWRHRPRRSGQRRCRSRHPRSCPRRRRPCASWRRAHRSRAGPSPPWRHYTRHAGRKQPRRGGLHCRTASTNLYIQLSGRTHDRIVRAQGSPALRLGRRCPLRADRRTARARAVRAHGRRLRSPSTTASSRASAIRTATPFSARWPAGPRSARRPGTTASGPGANGCTNWPRQ